MFGQYKVQGVDEMVNLGVGQPRNETLKRPLGMMKEAMEYYSKELDNEEVLQYGDVSGYSRFRNKLGEFLRDNYNYENVSEDSLFQTNGATEGVSLLTLLLSDKSDLVLVENPTYFLMINIFKELGREVRGVKLESDGISIDDLEMNLERKRRIILYLIPYHHNPTGVNLSVEKRERLVELLDKYSNLYVICDEVYQELGFKENNNKPMSEYHNRLISVGSFSKVLAPVFRIGWVYSLNSEIMSKLRGSASRDSSGGNNVINSLITEYIIEKGYILETIESERERLYNNLEYVRSSLKDLEKYFNINYPVGGYFVWMELKEDYKKYKKLLLEGMEEYKVKFHCGNKFSIDKRFDDCIRISLSYYLKEEIKIGLERLYKLMSDLEGIEVVESGEKIGLMGYRGRLGVLILEELKMRGYEVLNIDRDVYNMKNLNECKIIIDVSSPLGSVNLIRKLMEDKLDILVIIGTTGHNESELEELSRYDKKIYVSNFSGCIKIMSGLVESVYNNKLEGYSLVMEDIHHINKKDSPSGTALSLVDGKDIEILSYRRGDVVGIHSLVLENEYESLKIIHNVKDRRLFSIGAVNMMECIIKKLKKKD